MARTRIVRGMLGVFGVAVLAAISGCAHVDAYNRGALAHPTMSAEDDITSSMDAHVREISEAASGGLSGGGGGCGCN